MKIKNNKSFYTGITILAILIISYFIKIQIDEGSNYTTQDSLLGIIIFHNPAVLLIYLIISAMLIFIGLKTIKIVN